MRLLRPWRLGQVDKRSRWVCCPVCFLTSRCGDRPEGHAGPEILTFRVGACIVAFVEDSTIAQSAERVAVNH